MKKKTEKPEYKVKIVKSSSDRSWYKDKINNEFDVTDDGDKNYFYVSEDLINKKAMGRLIAKEDCEIIA